MRVYYDPEPPEVEYVCENMRAMSREDILPCFTGDEADYARYLIRAPGHQWVIYADDKPAALIGAVPQRGRMWGLFGLGTDDWIKVWRLVTLVGRRDMMEAVKADGATRAHCTSPRSHVETHKWLRFLGATHEAELPAWGNDGEDYILFSWLRE